MELEIWTSEEKVLVDEIRRIIRVQEGWRGTDCVFIRIRDAHLYHQAAVLGPDRTPVVEVTLDEDSDHSAKELLKLLHIHVKTRSVRKAVRALAAVYDFDPLQTGWLELESLVCRGVDELRRVQRKR